MKYMPLKAGLASSICPCLCVALEIKSTVYGIIVSLVNDTVISQPKCLNAKPLGSLASSAG